MSNIYNGGNVWSISPNQHRECTQDYIKSIGVKNMIKSTGIVRKVDELGRIVLPIELRRTLDIEVSVKHTWT